MDFTTLKAGDPVFVAEFFGMGSQYTKGIVQKITSSGLIDVLIGCSSSPTRFNPDGGQRGKSFAQRRQIDDKMPFAEREADIAKRERIEKANTALRAIVPERFRYPEQSDLITEVERLQACLDAVNELIEAI